jgi:hypothetical protein
MFTLETIQRSARTAFLALLLPCIFCGSGVVVVAAAESGPVVPFLPEGEVQEKTFKETIADFDRSVDKTYEKLEQDIYDRVKRLDDFFGNVQTENLRDTSYEFRLRSGIRIEEGGKLKPDITLRANIVLPRTSEKLRLFIAGENEVDSLSPSLPDDPGNPGFDRAFRPSARIVNTEFRYRIFDTPNQNLFLGAGVRLHLPPEAFTRARYQYTHHISSLSLLRLGETIFLKDRQGLGETTELTYERLIGIQNVLRLANSATLSQAFDGLEWGSELSLIRALSETSAITFTGGIYLNSDLSTVVNNYRLLTRYRQQFLKKWLFYEVEPEISWPRGADGRHDSRLALTFRLEILIDKKE